MAMNEPTDGAAGGLVGRIWAGAADTVRGWDRFWFGRANPTTLGLIRICCGLVVLYVHLVYTFDLDQLFGRHAWVNLDTVTKVRQEGPVQKVSFAWGQEELPPTKTPEDSRLLEDWGVHPAQIYAKGQPIWSVWFHVTDPGWMLAVHLLILLVMLLFTLGFCTRVTAVLTWMGAMSYIHRAETTLFGMDTMMNVLLIYLMIGPSGAALSLDRLLARWWTVRRARLAGRPEPGWQPPAPSAVANFALRLMQIHLCIIYLASGTSKLLGASWWNGTALWGTIANYEFAPMDWARYQDLLDFLAAHRVLWEVVMSGGVIFTLFLEIGFPFLVWHRRLRWIMIISAVLLHIGIAMTMGLTTFGLFMLCLVLSFVPGETVEHWLQAALGPARSLARAGEAALRERRETAVAGKA